MLNTGRGNGSIPGDRDTLGAGRGPVLRGQRTRHPLLSRHIPVNLAVRSNTSLSIPYPESLHRVVHKHKADGVGPCEVTRPREVSS